MKVEIWSDVVCPSCYIGKRKFEAALTKFKDSGNIEIVWKSFQLAPDLKTDPDQTLYEFLVKYKGLSLDQAIGAGNQITNSAKQAGLIYNLRKAIPANSFNANRLSHLAKHYNLQNEVEESLFKAYFTDGENIDAISTLVKLGKEIGLDTTEVKNVLESNQYAEEVQQDINEAGLHGINSVPTFVFNGKSKVSGVQEEKTFLEMLTNSFADWQNEHQKKTTEVIEGQSCKIGENC